MSGTSSTGDQSQSTTEGQEANQQQEGSGQAADTTDWKAEARKWEQRAKANTEAADRLQALEDAQKSDAERQAEALKSATAERDEAQQKLMRFEIASEAGVPLSHAHRIQGSTREELAEDAKTLANLLADRKEDTRKEALVDKSAGRTTEAGSSPGEQFAAAIQNL